jgi:hypothetical protein
MFSKTVITITDYNKTSTYLASYLTMALQPLCTLVTFQFLNLYTVGGTPRMEEQPVARPLTAHRKTQTSMPRMGFELMIAVFEWAKMVHAVHDLGRAATVTGIKGLCQT